MSPPRVVLRADGGGTIGVGHVMRSITLGTALAAAGARVVLASHDLPHPLRDRATAAGIDVADLDDPSATAPLLAAGPDLVVVDGYLLGAVVEDLVAAGIAVGVIDDNHELPVGGVRFVLNHNPHATPDLYADASPATHLLLGTTYALIRPDVVALDRDRHRAARDRPLVLVALGGADPLGLTLGLTEALVDAGCDAWVGVGATNPHRDAIVTLAAARPDRVRLDGGDLLEGYATVDVAAVGAGTTMWELGHLGIPGIAVVVADNQAAGARLAAEHGFLDVVDVRGGEPDVAAIADRCRDLAGAPARRAAMAAAGPALFDGHGAARAARSIFQMLAG